MFVSRVWLTICVAALAALVRSDEPIKRLPSGFQGMRGKKSIDYSGLDDNLMLQNDIDKIPYYSLPNLRENSKYFGDVDPYMYVRAQAAQLNGYPDHIQSLKRAPMGFQGMRGKKNLIDTGPLYRGYDAFDFDGEYMEKRGPMGFQGMRGKRQFEYPSYAYTDKRAPVGFQGMRGKKSSLSDAYLQTFDGANQQLEIDSNKQVQTTNNPSINNELPANSDNLGNSFEGLDNGLGMTIGNKERRSPSYGFLGVRGKKMPSASTFFGMRGKKGPDYPFKGKFVGVRGRRTYQEKPDDMQQMEERLGWNADSFEKRRGPSGFLGMRGKKWVLPESDLTAASSGHAAEN